MKKVILVPIDFSDCSKNALLNAIGMARQWNCKLHLIHSYLMPSQVFVDANSGNSFFDIVQTTDVNSNFKKLINNEIPELNSIEFECSLKQGRLHAVINDYTKMEDIEMVVMGTHGASGVKELLMGSNAYSVIKETQLPVMIFPEKSGIIKYERFAFLSGFKNLDNPHEFKPFHQLVERTSAEVDIIHFTQKGDLKDEMVRENKIKLYIGDVNRVVHVCDEATLEKDVHDYVVLFDIDLLVMIPKKHNPFEVLFGKEAWSQKLIFHTNTPMFVLPS